GLLRGREFVMADSYTFDVDDAGLAAAYARHREAFVRIFERLGLPYVIVAAVSGAMGGAASEEFLAPLDAGEATFAACPACGYAANVEAVRTPPAPPVAPATVAGLSRAWVADTPGTATIAALVDHANGDPELARADGRPWTGADTLKN